MHSHKKLSSFSFFSTLVHLVEIDPAQIEATLDERAATRAKAEYAIDRLRQKFGKDAIDRGLVFEEEASQTHMASARRKPGPGESRDS